jgi:pimeloyl-ACP methyl ester carboxylesterase
MPHIDANGISIYVETHGDRNATPLILVRGLGSQIVHWPKALIEGFVANGFFVVTHDNRDAGLSQKFDDWGTIDEADVQRRLDADEPLDVPYRLEDLAADAMGVLDRFGIDRAHLVGMSMGGMIAQLAAAHYPERLISMTSVMSSSGNPAIPLGTAEARAQLLEQPDDPNDRASVIAFTLKADRVWGSPAYPFDDAERAELIGRAFDRCWTPEGVKRQWAAARANGSRVELLKTIRVPSLVIHGLDDALVQAEHGRDTAANIPGAELVEIPGMGHDLEGDIALAIVEHVTGHARRAEAA